MKFGTWYKFGTNSHGYGNPENISISTKAFLILLMSAFFAKNIFLGGKIVTLLKRMSVGAVFVSDFLVLFSDFVS